MADISEVKVSGVTYNIKDIPGRHSGYVNVIQTWDGNIEGLELIQVGDLSYYRIGDSIQTNNYLIGEMMNMNKQLKNVDSEMIIVKLLMGLLGDATLYTSSISLKHKFKEMISPMFSNLDEEVFAEMQTFMDNNHVGFWLGDDLAFFLNIPITTTLSATLTKAMVGVEEEITIPEGLWVTNIEMGEEFGYRTYPVFPSIIYETTPSTTLYIDHMLSSYPEGSEYYVNMSSSGLSSYEVYSKSFGSYNPTNYFTVDQTVYIKCTMPSSSYEITEITAIGNNSSTSYSLEETSGNTSGANIKWYKFYMPEEQVNVSVTCTAVTTTTTE